MERELNEIIDFSKINYNQFEELCFELLPTLGYESLTWRKGPADKGRDIEGRLRIQNKLTGEYQEHWFFECKHYAESLNPERLNSNFAWADAERPNHFVILASSYMTIGGKEWLEKFQQQKSYRIHVVEGIQLKKLLAKSPELIEKYFGNEHTDLLQRAKRTWIDHGILPDAETLSILRNTVNPLSISTENLAFLWCAGASQADKIGQWCEEGSSGSDSVEPFNFDFLAPHLHLIAKSTGFKLDFQSLPPAFQYKKEDNNNFELKVEASITSRSVLSTKQIASIRCLCRYTTGLVVAVEVTRYPEQNTKIESIDLHASVD